MKALGSGEEPCMEKEIGARFTTVGSQDQGLRPATQADGDGSAHGGPRPQLLAERGLSTSRLWVGGLLR